MENNIVKVVGTLNAVFTFDHKTKDEEFYMAQISVARQSGNFDYLQVMVSKKVLSDIQVTEGARVEIQGSFRSYNYPNGTGRNSLRLYIFAEIFNLTDKEKDENSIILNGYLCKPPIYRETPLGRKICDICIAVNRHTIKSDYLPAVVWSRNAVYLSGFNVGDQVSLVGRIQSREYCKQIGTEREVRIVYEVSGSWVEAFRTTDRSDENDTGRTEVL